MLTDYPSGLHFLLHNITQPTFIMKASIICGALAATPLALAVKAPSVEGMKVIWSDDFNGCSGCDPNMDEWELRMHIDHNNELQEYTQSVKNTQLSGGDTLQLVPWRDDNGEWTSARIETLDAWEPKEGKKLRWQASFRMGDDANKQGIWPAFWMLGDGVRHGTDWPLCGELDIYEQVNGIMEAHGTVHCGESDEGGPCNEPSGLGTSTAIPDNDWHDWSLQIDRTTGDWTTESISWMRDGETFHTVTGGQIGDEGVWATLAHSPYMMIFNIAVGGDWPGQPSAATEDGFGNMFEIRYAAVYETE